MNIPEEIRAAFERLSAEERAALLASLQAYEDAHLRVAEPRVAYRTPAHSVMTVEEYLEFEDQSQIRHEYVDGHLFAMAGATKPHNRIIRNLVEAIAGRLQMWWSNAGKVQSPRMTLPTQHWSSKCCHPPRNPWIGVRRGRTIEGLRRWRNSFWLLSARAK